MPFCIWRLVWNHFISGQPTFQHAPIEANALEMANIKGQIVKGFFDGTV